MVPEGWQELSLDEIATYRRGSFPQPYGLPEWYDGDGAMPFVQVYDVARDQRLKPTTKQQISTEAMPKSVFVPEGSLLVTLQGSIGRVAITQYDAYVDRTLLIFTGFRTPTDLRFFSSKIEELFAEEKTKAPGGTIKTITKAVLSKFRITLPPLPEQRKIADILSTWDAAIEKTEALLSTAKAQKRALMQSLLTSRRRFPEFEGQPWKEVRLGDLGATFNGLTGKTKDDFGEGYPFIPYMNIFANSRIDVSHVDYVSVGHNERQSRVQYGDLFFTTSSETPNEVGMSSVMLDEMPDLFLNSFCFGFRLHNFETLRPRFARFFLRGQDFRRSLHRLAQGATRYNLSKTNLMNTMLVLPPVEEQEQIADALDIADFEENELKNEVAKLRTEKKALMQQLLTGKRRVVV